MEKTYECRECGEIFDVDEDSKDNISCPACKSGEVERVAADEAMGCGGGCSGCSCGH